MTLGGRVDPLCKNCGIEIVRRLLSRGDKTWFHNASFANVDEYCENADGSWRGTVAEPTIWWEVPW